MKKYLLPKNGKFYKANLHMHTTISDGAMTPEETKEAFLKEHGKLIIKGNALQVMASIG